MKKYPGCVYLLNILEYNLGDKKSMQAHRLTLELALWVS